MLEFSIPENIFPLKYGKRLIGRYMCVNNGSIRLVLRVDNFILLRLGKRDGVWREVAAGRHWTALVRDYGIGWRRRVWGCPVEGIKSGS